MKFTRGYKINKLYVARLGRVTKEEFIEGRNLLESSVCYHTELDGPIGIFTIKGKVAKRVSTDVDYYYYDGSDYPKKFEWYVNNVTPITQIYNFKDGVKAISLKEIKAMEDDLEKRFGERPQQENGR